MADLKLERSENVEGNFFVDSTCIDCGTCYWVSPETFKRSGDKSHVFHQPTESEKFSAYRALFSCPTNSIGVRQKEEIFKEVLEDFPHELAPGLYHCGFHAESSFGAASYFVCGEEENFLIDSPRFLRQLVKKFEGFGGIDWQLLTHQDDVADTDKYWEKFGATRVIHRDDVNRQTSHYEKLLDNEEEIPLTKDLTVIPVPGHTKGSVCYLYDNKYLFTGDHLAYSRNLGHLYAFRRACWYDFKRQIHSIEKLLDYTFEYVLPGHGAPCSMNKDDMRESLKKCVEWMKTNL